MNPRSIFNFVAAIVLSAIASMMAQTTVAAEAAATSAAPTSAALMRTVYLALIKENIVPADPRVVATAALAAISVIAPERVQPLPAAFGADAESDATWLAERVADLPPPWRVFDAMVRATKTAHVGFNTPERRQGMRAFSSGQPLSSAGFNSYPLADGRLVVFDVVKGASADASGLRAGDVLARVGGESVVRSDILFLNALPAGAETTLAIERAGRPSEITLRLIKADVSPVESRLLDDRLGYVFMRWFARSSDAEHDTAALARRAFTSLAAQGARGLIIDLRSCLGGSGEVSIASALCDGDVIYSVKQPLSAPARLVKRDGERCWPANRPIVVLVNEQTISAPECLALALRELAHAKIVGRTTGGGLTEFTPVPLADGHGLIVPTGVDLGPVTGENPAGHAIKPDIDVPNPTIDELMSGQDRQLEAARAALAHAAN